MTAALLVGPLRPGIQPALASAAIPVSLMVHPAADRQADVAAPIPPSGAALPETALQTYVVQPRDDLWLLAERHLGNPMRYKELLALNVGIPQPDGRALHNPDLIRPGWVLRFPDDAVELPEQATLEQPAAVEHGPDQTPTEKPGEACEAPAIAGAATCHGRAATGPTCGANETAERQRSLAAWPSREMGAVPGIPIGILGARPHREWRGHRPRPAPSCATTPAASRSHDPATSCGSSRTDRDGAAPCRGRQSFHPARCGVAGLRWKPERPTIRSDTGSSGSCRRGRRHRDPPFGTGHAPHGPFTVDAAGRAWTLPSEVHDDELTELASGNPAPLPALVSVGTSDAGTILIDLEASAVTALAGEREAAMAAMGALVLELATSVWAGSLDLVVVGRPLRGVGHLDRVRVVGHVSAVIDSLASGAAATSRALADAGYPSTLAARLSPAGCDGGRRR